MVLQNQETIPQDPGGERRGEDLALNAAHRAELEDIFIAQCPSAGLGCHIILVLQRGAVASPPAAQ